MSTVGLPAGSVGTVPVTVTGKMRLVPTLGSGLTVLVGGVVSISQEVETGAGARVAVLVLEVGGVDGERSRCPGGWSARPGRRSGKSWPRHVVQGDRAGDQVRARRYRSASDRPRSGCCLLIGALKARANRSGTGVLRRIRRDQPDRDREDRSATSRCPRPPGSLCFSGVSITDGVRGRRGGDRLGCRTWY